MVLDMDAMLAFVAQVQKELGESGWNDYKAVLQKLQQGTASRSDTVDSLTTLFRDHASLTNQFETFLPPEKAASAVESTPGTPKVATEAAKVASAADKVSSPTTPEAASEAANVAQEEPNVKAETLAQNVKSEMVVDKRRADTPEERQELWDCARYGELPELQELLASANVPINCADAQGVTALHRACANGHTDLVGFLLKNGALCMGNESNNSPLHWAIQNKHVDVVKLLCQNCPNVDVLALNEQGKSAVTFAFDASNTSILKTVLEHPTAASLNETSNEGTNDEGDMVLSTGDTAQSDTASNPKTNVEESEPDVQINDVDVIVQYFVHQVELKGHEGDDLAPGVPLLIREVGFMNNAAVDESETAAASSIDADLEVTGANMWAASVVLAHWLVDLRKKLKGARVVELGAGCGLPGIAVHKYVPDALVTITDLISQSYPNLIYNVDTARSDDKQGSLQVAALDWKDETTWPSDLVSTCDFVVGSDLVYEQSLVAPLLDTVLTFLKPDSGTFLYVTADTSRAGTDRFLDALVQAGLKMERSIAPAKYCTNPLHGASEEKFRLHFPEFIDHEFSMYRFTR